MEWAASLSPLFMASIFIKNLFSNDQTQFKWKWEQKNIIQMIKRLQSDEDEDQLNAFIKDASKNLFLKNHLFRFRYTYI